MLGGLDIATDAALDTDNAGSTSSLTPPVAITGMHRSGTSMVAKLLHQAGLHLGDEARSHAAGRREPGGVFRASRLRPSQRRSPQRRGGRLGLSAAGGVRLGGCGARALPGARPGAGRPRSRRPTWGWKDPRTSLTLPFWRSALGPLRVVVVVRNPARSRDLAASPQRLLVRAQPHPLADLRRAHPGRDSTPRSASSRTTTPILSSPSGRSPGCLAFLDLDPVRISTPLRAAAVPPCAITARRCRSRNARVSRRGPSRSTATSAARPDGGGQKRASCPARGRRRGFDRHRRRSRAAAACRSAPRRERGAAAATTTTSPVAAVTERIENWSALKLHEEPPRRTGRPVSERDSRLIERDALLARRDQASPRCGSKWPATPPSWPRLQQRIADLAINSPASERGPQQSPPSTSASSGRC